MSDKRYTLQEINRLIATGFLRWLDNQGLLKSDLTIDELYYTYTDQQLNTYNLPMGIGPSDIIATESYQ